MGVLLTMLKVGSSDLAFTAIIVLYVRIVPKPEYHSNYLDLYKNIAKTKIFIFDES